MSIGTSLRSTCLACLVWSAIAIGESSAPKEVESVKFIDAEVFDCHDGDTCRIKVANAMWMNIRLVGIDAPEVKMRKATGQPFGSESRDYLNSLVKGKTVSIRQTDLDPFNRPVVEMLVAGKSVNLAMIEQGFAEVYQGRNKRFDKAPLIAAEKTAKDKKVGIWSQSEYLSPKEYRKEAKK